MDKLRILIVEDEMIVAEDTKDILEGLNYTVVDIASSGEEAVRQVELLQPELVLMDINLKGGMDGIQAAEQIRSCFDIPVIYVTAYADQQTLQRAKITAPYGYILKPFKVKELLSVIEITLYKHQADKELKESEQWLSTTLSSIGDAVIATDNAGIITFMNPVAETLTGWPQAEAQGKTLAVVFEIVNETTGEPIPNPVELALREKRVVALANHTTLISRKGRRIPIEDSAAPIVDKSGNISGIVLVFHDITERKQKEVELARHREQLEAMVQERTAQLTEINEIQQLILNNVDEIVYLIELNNTETFSATVRFISNQVEKIIGYHPDEFFEIEDLWLKLIHPDDIQSLAEYTRRGFPDNLPATREYRMRHKHTGEYNWMEDRVTPQFDANGSLIGHFGVVRDITERKRAEEERRRLEMQMRQSQKMEAIGTLAGGIAHDFNNLLTPILGYAEMLQFNFPDGSKARKKADAIYQASTRAKELVDQILTFSRQVEHNLHPVRVDLLLKETLVFLRASLPATVELKKNIENNCSVLADSSQIHQVIMNLCTNAYQAMGEKGGTLAVALKKVELNPNATGFNVTLPKGSYLELTVCDTGPGIDPVLQQRIFDPFFTTKGANKGTGLGLSVVHGIVETINGALTLDSKLGQGTTVKVYLPRFDGAALPVQESQHAAVNGTKNVLLVDDNEMVLDVLGEMLHSLGFSVSSTSDSVEAMELFHNQPEQFNLVITDQIMAKMSGSELTQALLLTRPDIPIILITGYSETVTEESAKSLGIRGYLTKPITISALTTVIGKILG